MSLVPGELVSSGGRSYRISEVLDFEIVIAVDLETGRSQPLNISSLFPILDPGQTPVIRDIDTIADEEWKTAETRYAAIKPILENFHAGRREVEERAKEVGVDFTTLYRWLSLYRDGGTLEALIPEKRGAKKGSKRISIHAEEIIQDVIKDVYLATQRSSPQKVVREVRRRCMVQGLAEMPHPNTIRARIAEISERERLRKRGYKEKARNKFTPTPGSFPNADYPLSFVQIDHTPVDIMLVDDVYRKSIGRPWVTLAIDIYSRMVTGYYLSFDPPSVTSVAMCVAHSILPKDEWLLLHGVDGSWPVWGFQTAIHVDNGAEFRSKSFRNSCRMHGIRLEYRPPGTPRFGGHIERYLGTLATEIHDVPGTTFSTVKDRDGYDSEKEAVFTKSEFEKWLVTLICKYYFNNKHDGIGMPPIKKWEIGVFGNQETEGRGIPPVPQNRLTLLLDFLPSFSRTIQPTGVSIDGLRYYADALRPWINAEDPDHRGTKRKFTFRRDPRDISVVWFHDPDLEQYFRIPFADQSMPSLSIWEYNQAREKARQEGMKSVDERQVLVALTELREQVEQAAEKTKKARRMSQRRREHKKGITPVEPLKTAEPALSPPIPPAPQPSSGLLDSDFLPMDDVAW